MDGVGEKHAIVMAGFTAAALVAAFGINRVVRHRTRKRLVSVDSVSVREEMGLNNSATEESRMVVSETSEDHQEETCSVVSQSPSEALSIGTADSNYEQIENKLVELREKEKAKEKEELERLNSCMKELEGRIMKLSFQETEIIELKKRLKGDEEKLEKLNLQEVEITELKKKIEKDENQIQQLQEEVAMLREKKNIKKKHWWNKDASVHDAVPPVYVKQNSTKQK